jgi:glycosyltransferase involved in cell wall biosynthesis
MRIAHVAHTFLPSAGGAESFVHQLAIRQSSGHRTVVIVRWNRRRTAAARLGYPVIPLLPTTLRRADQLDETARWHRLIRAQVRLLQRRYRFDLWHFHQSYPDGWAMVPVLDEMGVPTVFTSHVGDLQLLALTQGREPLDHHRDRRTREAVRRFTGLTAISSEIEAYYIKAGVEPSRIRRISGGVDLARLRQPPDGRSVARRALGVRGPVLLTVANDRPEKGLDLIPAIADSLARSEPDFTWLVVGPSRQPGWATSLPSTVRLIPSQKLDLGERPLLLPPREVVSLYWAADVQVVPSRMEGLPLAVLEGMAAGLPIASTDAPGCIDLVSDRVHGLLSRVDDVAGMAENIARLLARPDERTAFGEAGRLRSQSNDWDTVARRYEDLYGAIIDRSRGHADL